jgi:hypothetical protein
MTGRVFFKLAAMVLASLLVPARAVAQSDDEVAVSGVVEAIARFSETGDWAGLDTLFAAGRAVHIIEGAGIDHGWTDYRDHHLKPELAEFENLRYRYFNVEPMVRGDIAWASFQYELAADTPRGHVEVEGRGTAILERSAGRWLVVHLHTSGRRKQSGG